MFFGSSEHTLDAKFRVFVPKRIVDVLGRDAEGVHVVYLSAGQDPCLYLFSEETFQVVLGELENSVFDDPKARAASRMFFANTVRAELDSTGRLLIPEPLRKRAGIERDVVIVGNRNRAEIWARDAWQRYEQQNDGVLAEMDTVARKSRPEPGRS